MVKKLKVYAGATHPHTAQQPKAAGDLKERSMIGNWNYGTGRRKSSVARVFIKKGTGQILVNGKAVEEYFGRQTSIMIVKQPLMLTDNDAAFDIKVNVHGGGESGQAGAVRHGITRALIDYDAALKPDAEPRRLRDARRARSRAQEGRPARRSPSQAVQQALTQSAHLRTPPGRDTAALRLHAAGPCAGNCCADGCRSAHRA